MSFKVTDRRASTSFAQKEKRCKCDPRERYPFILYREPTKAIVDPDGGISWNVFEALGCATCGAYLSEKERAYTMGYLHGYRF